jgi:HAD superfamily hydrolase (TIGR01490 family)
VRLRRQTPPVPRTLGEGGLALFDLDRTLVPGSSLVVLARALVDAGVVSRATLLRGLASNAVFARRGASDARVERLRTQALDIVSGVDRGDLAGVVGDVVPRLASSLYPAGRWLVERHLAAGDFCVLVSAAPQGLVEALVRATGMHRAVGTRAEVVEGKYTGNLDGVFCYGPGKVARLEAELGTSCFVNATAYADSASDLPLLHASGRPVAVNPDRRLSSVARQQGWPVLRLG